MAGLGSGGVDRLWSQMPVLPLTSCGAPVPQFPQPHNKGDETPYIVRTEGAGDSRGSNSGLAQLGGEVAVTVT